ncbi:MAG: cellulose binding domain-containing protein, partial [Myxococcota bacterium]
RWWGGFTAELQLHNPGSADLDEWQFMFRSTHTIAGAWGAAIEATDFGGGLYEYRVSGSGWASSIPAGGSVTVGFNGQQGTPIGNSGPLSEAMLFE